MSTQKMSTDWLLVVLQEIASHYCDDYCIKPCAERGETPDCENCTEYKVLGEVAKRVQAYEEKNDGEEELL